MNLVNEMTPLAGTQGNMAADVIKTLIGERKIDMFQTWKNDSLNKGKKDRLKGFGDFLGEALKDTVMSNLSSITMGTALTLYNFDWNKSEKAIAEQIEQNNLQMVTVAGQSSVRGAISFAGLGVTKKAVNQYPKVDPTIFQDIEEDLHDELKSSIINQITLMRSSLQNSLFLSLYGSGRKMMGFGEGSNEPWILTDQIDKIIEKNQDKYLKGFLTGAKEEAEDAILDLGFLMTNGVQLHWNMMQNAKKDNNGPYKVVKYTPDQENPQNYTWLAGGEENIKNAIHAARLNDISIADRDVGTVAMVGLEQAMKGARSKRIITFQYYSGINGATVVINGDKKERAKEMKIKVSNIKRTADWDKFKAVAQPVDGGPWRVEAKLTDGHSVVGYFLNEAKGKAFINPVISQLCEGDLMDWIITPPPEKVSKRKDVAQFSVGSAKLLITDETADITKKRYTGTDGKYYRTATIKLKLNARNKPDNIDAMIANPFVTITV